MGNISNITKVVDFYKSDGFNATVTVEEKRTCIIDGHGTNNIKMLIADYKFQVEEEVEESRALKKINKAFLDFKCIFQQYSLFYPKTKRHC